MVALAWVLEPLHPKTLNIQTVQCQTFRDQPESGGTEKQSENYGF